MDLQMPRVDGLTAAREERDAHPHVRIVILTGGLTPAPHEAVTIGVAGYLPEDDDPADLPEHIRAAATGERRGTARCGAARGQPGSGGATFLAGDPVALRRRVP
jgi:DNA-binding NarL/FixJ family response regulator